MSPREHVINTLILEGCDERSAEAALAAVRHWLTCRVAELRAERKNADAAWYARVRGELE